jgi:hypothetical protein
LPVLLFSFSTIILFTIFRVSSLSVVFQIVSIFSPPLALGDGSRVYVMGAAVKDLAFWSCAINSNECFEYVRNTLNCWKMQSNTASTYILLTTIDMLLLTRRPTRETIVFILISNRCCWVNYAGSLLSKS